MANTSKLMCGTGAAGIALMALAGSALADGEPDSVKDAPADEVVAALKASTIKGKKATVRRAHEDR